MTPKPVPGPDRADPATVRRPPLHQTAKQLLLAALLRNIDAHDNLSAAISQEHWIEMGLAHCAVWSAARDYRATFGALPNGTALVAAAVEVLEGYGAADDEIVAAVRTLVDWVFDRRRDALATDPTVPAKSAAVASRLLEEEAALTFSRSLFDGAFLPADVSAVADRFADQIRKARAVVRPAVPRLFGPGWAAIAEAATVPLGVDLLDNYFGGGMRGGEVALFMAPFGVCKTVVAVQTVFAAARRCEAVHRDGGPHKVAVFVSTEMAAPEAQWRLITHGAQIPYSRLKAIDNRLERLSDDPRPGMRPQTAYELDRFSTAGGVPFRSEKRRVTDVEELCSRYVLFVELTDSNEHLRGSPGAVEDAAGIVSENLRRLGVDGAEIVVLDHASAMAARVVERTGPPDPDRATRRLLKVIPLRVRDLLARKYGCPALVMHQLSGEANSKSPFAELHHSHGAECKSVAEYCDFAMVVGQTSNDGDTRLAVVRVTKPRREAPKPPGVVKIDGDFATVVDASRVYKADFAAREFVPLVSSGAAYSYPAPPGAAAAAAPIVVFPPGLDVS